MEDIITFEQAKFLKKLGYHEHVKYFYSDAYDDEDYPHHEYEITSSSIVDIWDWNTHKDEDVYSAPLLEDAIKWLETNCKSIRNIKRFKNL